MPNLTLGRVGASSTGLLSSNQNSDSFELSFSGNLQALLITTANANSWKPPDLFLAVFMDLLRRYTGQSNVSVGTPNGIVSLAGNPSLRQLLRQIHDQESSPADTTALDGQFLFSGEAHAISGELTSGISCFVHLAEQAICGLLRYDRKTWHPNVVEGFACAYQKLLQLSLSQLDKPLADLDIIAPAEALQFEAWNRTSRPYPSLRADQLFEQQVARTPQRPAVTFQGKTLTYRELSEQVNYLAARLSAMDIGPGALIGICLERSPQLIVALLAVLKAGAAYLPLDPSFPADRLAFMQADARPLAVITQSNLLSKLPFTAPQILTLDPIKIHEWDGRQATPAAVWVAPSASSLDNLAYTLYTSGSTGKPKGVPITHRALTNLLVGVSADLSLDSSDVLLATSTISFDISAFEIFAPLLCGAHLVVAPPSVAVNGELLAEAIQNTGCTVLQATPSGWRTLLESGWTGKPGLKMLTAGEHLDRSLAQQLLQRGASLWNLYGPTEAAIYATGHQVTQAETRITIGKPLANYRTFVLDHNRKRVPFGAIGELYIGGVGVTSGYLDRPELNEEKFIQGDLGADFEKNLFRTGDLARFLPDGQIDLLGRTDNQIKLRGCRIELEEIESLLDAHPSIRKSAVKILDLKQGDQRLVAYITTRYPDPLHPADLREYVQRTLPAYMVPSAYLPVDVFPLTPSGKIDRKALPSPDNLHFLVASDVLQNPGVGLEQTVLHCWRKILTAPQLELDDNFFDMGGHSLLATRMSAELNKQLDCKIRPNCLVEAPTARQFAEHLRRLQNDAPSTCIVPMQTSGPLPPVYLIHHLLGDIFVYRALAACFAPDRPVFGIHAPADFIARSHPFPLASLAAEYVAEILTKQSSGPFHLVGYSSGSVLAFEMAHQLSDAGFEIGLLALIDGEAKTTAAHSKPVSVFKTIRRKICKVVFKFKDEFSDGLRVFIMNRVRHAQLQRRVRSMQGVGSSAAAEITLEQALLLCENAYQPQPYSGSAFVIRFHDEAWKFGPDPWLGWDGVVKGGIEAIDAPGGHITGMNPARASTLARLLRIRLQKSETPVELREHSKEPSFSRDSMVYR